MAARITDEEWDKLSSENFETHSLLRAVDAVDELRDDLNDGEYATPPHGRVAFLPCVPVRLKCLKPRDVLPEPATLGEHIKRRRLELGFTQKEACALLANICVETLINWEKDKTDPPIPFVPAILHFLGYDPFPPPCTLGERMLAKRRTMGWTIKKAAARIGVDESTWGEWERTGCVRWERHRLLLEVFLQDHHC